MDFEKKIELFVKAALKTLGKPTDIKADEPLISSGKLDSLFTIDLILFLEDEFKLDFSKDNITAIDVDSLKLIKALVQKKTAGA